MVTLAVSQTTDPVRIHPRVENPSARSPPGLHSCSDPTAAPSEKSDDQRKTRSRHHQQEDTMSDLGQAALISGAIFAVVMTSQYGRRAFTARSLIRPVAMIAAFGYFYLKGMPFGSHGDLAAYGVAVVLGLLFGAAATVATRVERDADGTIKTVCGPAFAGIWLLAVVLRLGFIWTVDNVEVAREHFGTFMFAHQISLDAIAPFFVIWALTMVISRVAVLAGRASALRNEAADARARVHV
jgi:hypothetical protein